MKNFDWKKSCRFLFLFYETSHCHRLHWNKQIKTRHGEVKMSLLIIHLWVDLLHNNTAHLSCTEESVCSWGQNACFAPPAGIRWEDSTGVWACAGTSKPIKRHCACQLCHQVYVCFPVLEQCDIVSYHTIGAAVNRWGSVRGGCRGSSQKEGEEGGERERKTGRGCG